jgi:hypothetical protein|uniref:Uncharacterized protein n=1 Tax=viral metagenome TaxID=1070528 RepID=A0A6C0DXE2_9ZZZZ
MTYSNEHSDYITKKINIIRENKTKWNSKIVDTTHEDFIRDYGSSVFTNLIRNTFTGTYVKKFKCGDCHAIASERCHGKGEERPLLLKRALEKVWPDTSKPISMKIIVIAFLEEHKTTKFSFKCHTCHVNEK